MQQKRALKKIFLHHALFNNKYACGSGFIPYNKK